MVFSSLLHLASGVMSPLAMLWYFVIFAILSGYLVDFYPRIFPAFLRKLYRYGKTSGKLKIVNGKLQLCSEDSGVLLWFRIPKRYFSHFYIFASAYAAFATIVLLTSYYHHNVPRGISHTLDIIAGEPRSTNVNSVASIVAMLLYLLHVVRRAYECLCVSVYSSSCKINVIHYATGLIFYFGVATSLLAEAPGFTSEGFRHKSFQQAYDWKWYQVFGTAFYFWVVWHQSKCTTILANMRKDKKGHVINNQHGIPMGDWFEFVSNPHYFAEILIYVALNVVLEFQNTLVILALLFTIVSQVFSGLTNHKWYVDTYLDYPKDRKAIIPFVL